jgi:hypothetical protein
MKGKNCGGGGCYKKVHKLAYRLENPTQLPKKIKDMWPKMDYSQQIQREMGNDGKKRGGKT